MKAFSYAEFIANELVLDASGNTAGNLASVDKGIHNKTTKYGLPTY